MVISRLCCLALALLVGGVVSGQQLSLFTQYRENATLINPAALESDFLAFGYNMGAGVNYRRQWAGLANMPTTQSARFNYIDPDITGATYHAGGYLLNDQTGPTGYTGVYGRIGTIISQDPEDYGISIGLSAGYVSYRVNVSEFVVRDNGDFLLGADRSQSHPDLGLGVYAYTHLRSGDLIYGGLSIPQLLGFDITYQDPNGNFAVTRLRHYYANAGYYYFVSDESFIEFSSWAKYVEGAPFDADFNVRYQLPTAPFIGVGMSTSKNFHFEAGLNIGQATGEDANFRLGYGFDYSFTDFGPSVGGSHEIQLSVGLYR